MLRRVALVRTDVSEELSASFIRVTKIGELGKAFQKTPFFVSLDIQARVVAQWHNFVCRVSLANDTFICVSGRLHSASRRKVARRPICIPGVTLAALHVSTNLNHSVSIYKAWHI
jgi:hypothetical protein